MDRRLANPAAISVPTAVETHIEHVATIILFANARVHKPLAKKEEYGRRETPLGGNVMYVPEVNELNITIIIGTTKKASTK